MSGRSPDQVPLEPGSYQSVLMHAVEHTALYYDYYTPGEIRSVKGTFVNEGSLALKGMVHSMVYDKGADLYTAVAAVGNAAAHDNLRVVAGATNNYGYIPPEDFAHNFGGIYTRWYPLIDKTDVHVVFDDDRPNATAEQEMRARLLADVIAYRLETVTSTLGRSILHRIHPIDEPLRGKLSIGRFKLQVPAKRTTQSTFSYS